MLIAALSTLISSIALIGVAISLLLQARQLRSSRVQAAHTSQLELIRFAIDNPTMTQELAATDDSETYVKDVIRNWYISHLSLSYDLRDVSVPQLKRQASRFFEAEGVRTWWAKVRDSYSDGPTTRRGKEFFTIVDGE